MSCNAVLHDTERANRLFGCTCPEALEARRAMRPRKVRGRSGPGRPEARVVEERAASIRRLTRAGESASEIAVRLGVAERTVTRYRKRLREEACAR